MQSLFEVVRLSLRSQKRNLKFFLLVVATLGLGIGGNAAIFSVVNNIFLRRLPFPEADRLVRLHMASPTNSGGVAQVNVIGAYFNDMREQSRLAQFVAMRGDNAALTGNAEPLRVSLVHISPGWMQVFAVRPSIGRYFSEEEEKLGAASRVAVISDFLWKQRFNGDVAVVNRTLTLEREQYSIVGVFPPGFKFPYQADIWIPATVPAGEVANDYAVFASLNPGTTLPQFREEMAALSKRMQSKYPGFPREQRISVTPGRESLISGQDQIAVALLALVGFLLLIACVDVTSLLLARSVVRRREFALRTALGASFWDHLQISLGESLTLALSGCALGLMLTKVFSKYLAVLIPLNLRQELTLSSVQLDYRVWIFALALTGLVALLCGGVPLLSRADASLYETLKQGGRTTLAGGKRRVLEMFVVGQIALALVLLTGAGLMIENFRRLANRPLGVDAAKTLTLACSLPRTSYLQGEQRTALVRNILASVEAVPGVSAAGISTVNPIYLYSGTWGARISREGWPSAQTLLVNHRLITPGLFRALGIPVREGRDFIDQDGANSEPVVIVSQALAQRMWPDGDALGRRIRAASRLQGTQWRTVVGVVADVQDAGDYHETWYVPYAQAPMGASSEELHLMVRSETDGAALAHAVAQAVWRVDSALPLRNISRLDNLYADTLVRERTGAIAITLFAAFGLVLASLGAFGVMSFATYQRTHEMGVRLTLGATPADILGMVLSWGGRLALIGSGLGIVGAVILNRVLAQFLEAVGKSEPLVFGIASFTLIATTLLACWMPARGASRVDPMLALRCE